MKDEKENNRETSQRIRMKYSDPNNKKNKNNTWWFYLRVFYLVCARVCLCVCLPGLDLGRFFSFFNAWCMVSISQVILSGFIISIIILLWVQNIYRLYISCSSSRC